MQSINFVENKIAEFREKFDTNNAWKDGDTAYVGIGNIEEFLRQSLTQAHTNGFKEGVEKSIEVISDVRKDVRGKSDYNAYDALDQSRSTLQSLLTTPESKQGEPN